MYYRHRASRRLYLTSSLPNIEISVSRTPNAFKLVPNRKPADCDNIHLS